jgi:hypothetical protein
MISPIQADVLLRQHTEQTTRIVQSLLGRRLVADRRFRRAAPAERG